MAAKLAWAADPVHSTGDTYAKMYLNLLEAMAPSDNSTARSTPSYSGTSSRDRKRDENRGRSNREASDSGAGRKRRFSAVEGWSATRNRQDRSRTWTE
jgi:hypothetical protein